MFIPLTQTLFNLTQVDFTSKKEVDFIGNFFTLEYTPATLICNDMLVPTSVVYSNQIWNQISPSLPIELSGAAVDTYMSRPAALPKLVTLAIVKLGYTSYVKCTTCSFTSW